MKLLRIYLVDPCPEVVLYLVISLQRFIRQFPHIHMVAESLIRLLVYPLSYRQRLIRYNSICVFVMVCL